MICRAQSWYQEHLQPTNIPVSILLHETPEEDSLYRKSSYITLENFVAAREAENPELVDLIVRANQADANAGQEAIYPEVGIYDASGGASDHPFTGAVSG